MNVGSRVMQIWPLHAKGRTGTITDITGYRAGDMAPQTVLVDIDGVGVIFLHVDNLAGMDTEVRTTYVGATDTTGARIIVRGSAGRMSVPYDHAAYDAHVSAAETYVTKRMGMAGASGTRIRYTRSRRGFVIGISYV